MYFAIAFASFAVACTVLAFTRHPIYGFYFYLATTFVYPQGRWWGEPFQNMRLALISAAVTMVAIALHRGKLEAKPFWLANAPAAILTTYGIWMWLQTPWALDLTEHLNGSSVFVKYLLAFWFVYRVVDSKSKLLDLVLALVVGSGILGLFAYFTGREGDRLDGVGGPGIDDSNTLGMYLASGAMLAIGLVMTQRGWRRYLSLVCLAVIVNAVVLANSRGSVLGLGAGCLVLALVKARQHRRVFWSFMLAGVIAGAYIVDQAFIDRMFTISDFTSEDEKADASARSRVVIAQAQLEMFRSHPMGIGHRGTATLSASYLDDKWLSPGRTEEEARARSSHNTFLTALVEQGLIGALLYAALVLWILGAGWRIRRANAHSDDPGLTTLGGAITAALTVIFVSGNSADYLLAENQFWLFAALVSMLQFSAASARVAPGAQATAGLRRWAL